MKAGKHDEISISHRLANFLLTYILIHSTQWTPCSLFLNHTIRTRLNLLRPNLEDQVLAKQTAQRYQHNQYAQLRSLEAGQPVMVKNQLAGWSCQETARTSVLSVDEKKDEHGKDTSIISKFMISQSQ